MITTHDMDEHLVMVEQFDKALRSGILYPRWQPDINGGYGIAFTNFYSPGFYYLASLVNLAVRNWLKSLLLLSALFMAASGLSFYVLSGRFYGRVATGAAAVLYMAFPYHILDLYWRGALPEFASFALFPPIIYFAYRLGGSDAKPRHYAGLGLSFGLLLFIHLATGLLMAYTLAFYAVLRATSEKDWRVLLRIGAGMILALTVSAIYLLPAALEARYTFQNFAVDYPYHQSYITVVSAKKKFYTVLNAAFAIQCAVLVAGALALLAAKRRFADPTEKFNAEPPPRLTGNDKARSPTGYWVIIAIATMLMNTPLSIYISRLLPKIEIVAFPWRWMAVSSVFVALVVAAAIDNLWTPARATKQIWAYRVALCASLALCLGVTVKPVITRALAKPLMSRLANYVEPNCTPAGSTHPEELPDTPLVVIEPEGGSSEVVSWLPQHRGVAVNVEQSSAVRLKCYNFHGWTARIDGQPVELLSDAQGVQVVNVPPGSHLVETDFANTPLRRLAAGLTIVGLLSACGLVLSSAFRK